MSSIPVALHDLHTMHAAHHSRHMKHVLCESRQIMTTVTQGLDLVDPIKSGLSWSSSCLVCSNNVCCDHSMRSKRRDSRMFPALVFVCVNRVEACHIHSSCECHHLGAPLLVTCSCTDRRNLPAQLQRCFIVTIMAYATFITFEGEEERRIIIRTQNPKAQRALPWKLAPLPEPEGQIGTPSSEISRCSVVHG